MLPVPLLIVICIIGGVTAAIFCESVLTITRNLIKRRSKTTPPLSTCEQDNSNNIL
jgi:hypothetical protein